MNIDKTIEKLYSLQKFGIKLGLENIKRLCEHLGNPQNNFRSFHVGGTNGKGSTSSFMASILKESGFKTGLYTSPHFIKFNERIRINGEGIPDNYIVQFYNSIEQFIKEHNPTFFEVTTALAFLFFAENNIDYAVIEVGLGGRLDATNIIIPEASIITSISLEHTELLGCTINEIAGEKAGIIKKNVPVFIGNLPEEAEKQIELKCIDLDCELFKLSNHIVNDQESLYLKSDNLQYKIITPLMGSFQKYNSALAVLALHKTLQVSKASITEGLNNVVRNSGIQGRYEIYNLYPRIILDSAHNEEGVKTFLSSFKAESGKYSKRILIFGVMKDKAVKKMLTEIAGIFDEIWVTSIDNERSKSKEELRTIGNELNIKTFVLDDVIDFIHRFISINSDECLVILGSMYVLGDIKLKLLNKSA